MNHRDAGFLDELTKVGGLARSLLKNTVGLAAKHPMKTLGIGMIAAPTVMAYQAARKGGLEGGEKPRYLAAGVDESGRVRASDAAYTNYHSLFKHKPRPHEIAALSKNYKPEMFSRASDRSKEK